MTRFHFSVVIVPQRDADAHWHQMRSTATSIMTSLSGALIVDHGEVTSTEFRCVRLLQWMRETECIDLHASFKNFPHGWIGRKVATVQHLRARKMRYQTDIGNGGRIAAAKPSCSRII